MEEHEMPLRVMRIMSRTNVGGPAVQAVTLMKDLPSDRFEQRLYAGSVAPGETEFLQLRACDVPVSRIPLMSRRVRFGGDARAIAYLVAEMREFRPHIVHTHATKAGVLGRLAAAVTRVPARVHTFHGHLLHGYFAAPVTRGIVLTERALARHTDRLIAVGGQVRDDLLAAGIGRQGQYVVVPPGTLLGPRPDRLEARRLLGVPPSAQVVAYVGRLTRIKRPDRLVAVAAQVSRAVPSAQVLICGHGDLAAEVESAASASHGRLRMLGWRADVEVVYAAADVVVLTSDNEGMPLSLIEAALAGVPVVTTNVGSVGEVVQHGVTGLVIETDAAAVARGVTTLLADDRLRRDMGARACAWAQARFASRRLVSDIERVYESIAIARGWWRDARAGAGITGSI